MALLLRLLSLLTLLQLATAIGQKAVVSFNGSLGGLQLAGGQTAQLMLSSDDWPGVVRAGKDLAMDFGRVTGTNLTMTMVNGTAATASSGPMIIAGTIGKSALIDSMVSAGKLDVSEVKGKWESFTTTMVANPMSGVSQAMVIAGSDKRGAIYGLYDVSEQIGVSPWYWWADVPAQQKSTIYALNSTKVQGPPAVKFRGLFFNDEQPALSDWVEANYPNSPYGPGFTHAFYSTVFELLLRLRANYLWPAEWNSMFYPDDPLSPEVADMYGVVIGSSHTEPLLRWTKEQSLFLNGTWSWSTNEANVTQFMREGAERSKGYESLYTMGMRGLGDAASPTLNASSLGDIVKVQQGILTDVFSGSNISSDIYQMWCLYKEVGGYFQEGLRVPDDISLLWADDNWGNAQRLPLANETDRSAGAGIYYHFDYVGDPRDYKWINTINLQKTWEQMNEVYNHDARQIWIVNVGDLKGLVRIPPSKVMMSC